VTYYYISTDLRGKGAFGDIILIITRDTNLRTNKNAKVARIEIMLITE